jgi:hypothetical protein
MGQFPSGKWRTLERPSMPSQGDWLFSQSAVRTLDDLNDSDIRLLEVWNQNSFRKLERRIGSAAVAFEKCF